MLARATITGCLAALLLTPSFAQDRYSPPQQHPQSQPADGQWHRFQKEGGPGPSRPNQFHPPQNQPGHAGNWLRRYKDMPPAQQRRALENDPQFRRLPPQQQAQLQRRLQHFSSLPPGQQERILRRMEVIEHLTPDQRRQLFQVQQQLKQLSPARRQAVKRAVHDMRNLTPEQRDRLINSQPYRNAFSPQERAILSGAAHLPLAPGDGLQAEPPE